MERNAAGGNKGRVEGGKKREREWMRGRWSGDEMKIRVQEKGEQEKR